MRLEEVHKESLAAYINGEFQVIGHPAGSIDLRLVEASDRGTSARQEIFALLFHGPGGCFLPQGIYRLEHDDLGEIDLFLVPVGQDQEGFQYEAVFNRLISPKKKEV